MLTSRLTDFQSTVSLTAPSCAFPIQFRQPSISGLSQITSSLCFCNGAAASNEHLLSSNQITPVINISVEGMNTFYNGVQYTHVRLADVPTSLLYDFFDSISDHIHNVKMKQGCCPVSPL